MYTKLRFVDKSILGSTSLGAQGAIFKYPPSPPTLYYTPLQMIDSSIEQLRGNRGVNRRTFRIGAEYKLKIKKDENSDMEGKVGQNGTVG